MKTMWTSEGTIERVGVVMMEGCLYVRDARGELWPGASGTLHETETEARRAKVEREATALEEQADRHDRQRVDAEVLASSHMNDAEWNRVKAAEMRARAKKLREALAEIDAVEGRR
jgi:glutamate synthase domain-containing protein 3